jgi:hypothetical protein
MNSRNRILRDAVTLTLTLGVSLLQPPLPTSLGPSPARAAQWRSAAEPVVADGASTGDRGAPALADFDARRDPETNQINGAATLASAGVAPPGAIAKLRAKAPGSPSGVHVEAHPSGLAREVINFEGVLTEPAEGAPDRIARRFLADNAELFGLAAAEVRRLKITMEDPDRASGATFMKYEQYVAGVRVFDSEISVSVTARGEVLMATTGQLLPRAEGSPAAALSKDDAVARAFRHCGVTIPATPLEARAAAGESGLEAYANPLDASLEDVLAERTLVNVRGEARSAFHVYVDKGRSEWYETLVDANTGELLYRRNLYSHAFGTVFTENPTRGPRTVEEFVVNAAKYPGTPADDLWLDGPDTTGNNVDAYLDRDGDNHPDSTTGNGLFSGRATSRRGRFNFPFTLGVDPTTQQAAVVTNLFYFCNDMHDRMYSLGFTESARNFQRKNYGRGGKGGDFVKAEAQDGSGVNNATFASPPDGKSPRMQMFLFTGGTSDPSDDHDGSLDGDVVIHEYAHGVSSRLIGNGSGGLNGTQSRAMSEGWSDYWSVTAFDDPVTGEFVIRNAFSGARRTPYDGRTGPPNGNYEMLGNSVFGVHADGEVWCQTLVDLRNVLGAPVTDQIVFTGMKHTAVHPSMLSGRNGILAADRALTGGENACVIWTVFARHGMGYSASGNDGTSHNAAYDLPRECSHSPTDNAQFYTTDGRGGIRPLYGYGDWRRSWSTIVPGNFGGNSSTDLLFYDQAAGTGEFYTTDGAGHVSLLQTHTNWNDTWDLIVPGQFGGDGWTDLLFYDRETGVGLFCATNGVGGFYELQAHQWNEGWDLIVPGDFGGDGYTDLLFYDSDTGVGLFCATDGSGGFYELQAHQWNGGWDLIVPDNFGADGWSDILFYDRETGQGLFCATDGAGGFYELQAHQWNEGWDLIVPGHFGGDGWPDILFYDRETGVGLFCATNGAGGFYELQAHGNWRGNWRTIVPGNFGDDSWTDLLFYKQSYTH